MASYHSHAHTSKPRSTIVKPILRRLTQSEKNSLDLDRSAYDQDTGLGISEYGDSIGNGYGGRSSHDIASGGPGGGGARRGYHHRSTSNTSQFSTTTSGSGHGHHRTGSFVHPFAQTPRPYTPPLAGVGTTGLRASIDTSPALTEDEGVEYVQVRSPSSTHTHTSFAHPFRSASNLSSHSLATHHEPAESISGPPPPLRLQTKTHSSSSSRLVLATSHTDLQHTNTNTNSALSPTDQSQSQTPIQTITSPTDAPTPSTMRTSLDIAASTFRLRSRSEGLTTTTPTTSHTTPRPRSRTNSHATIHEARRRFAEKEMVKEEKAAREEIRLLEKRQMKEARARERGGRRSSASERPNSQKSKRVRGESGSTVLTSQRDVEKDGLVGRGYGDVERLQSPVFVVGGGEGVGGQEERGPKRSAAKLKTHSAWTKFVMWLRTRFIRMGSKSH